MADDKKTNEKKQRLLTLLREMFQLDQPDLDFGLYRIMHAKRGQVEAFLETEFDQLIDKVFADRGARHEEEAKKEYEAARQQAIEFGAPDPDAAPKVQQARARYEVVRLTGGEDAEIYDHLHRFFSRYYDQGDFMSLRRYGKGAAGGAETYAVPYDGSEVVLHWANKDQYYIKTTENFAEFSFDPRKALQKDERGISRSLFDEEAAKVGAGGTALKVHFRIVEAAEGAHNNVKASDKDERYFILDAEAPLALDDNELVIRINYRTDPEKTGQKAKWQDKRNEQLVQTVLESLKGLTDGGNALAGEYFEVLAREVSKGKDKKQPLLARYVGQYTASNTMDYFIHKDLGGFLRRELDFYLKNEVLKLDDFVGGEDADVQAGLTDARLKAMKEALEKAQAIRLLSQRLIDFLAQLEEFQKKLWLKKKFVVETHYCITLDRIDEKFYPEIAANDRQREEWVKLFAIDRIVGDAITRGYSVPLSEDFLKAHQSLMIDTANFGKEAASQIIETVDGLDNGLGGILINGVATESLRNVRMKLHSELSSLIIDPPYNTGSDGFPYKDSYKRSSWCSMIKSCMDAAFPMLRRDSILSCCIDDNEVFYLGALLDGVIGESNLAACAPWKSEASGGKEKTGLRTGHEYVLIYHGGDSSAITQAEKSTGALDRADKWGAYRKGRELRKWGGTSRRIDRPNQWFELVAPDGSKVFPIKNDGTEGHWRWGKNNAAIQLALTDHEVFHWEKCEFDNGVVVDGVTERWVPFEKIRDIKKSVGWATWLDTYGTNADATRVLKDLFGHKPFETPKPVSLYEWIISLTADDTSYVLDFTAGSGTTAHAVINLNLQDEGNRRYLLIEMGDHLFSVIIPRIKKIVFSDSWSEGYPLGATGTSHCFKYLRTESYEDCLNNLALNPIGEAVAKSNDAAMQRDYLLRYMLDVETQGSQSLLNVAQFRDPTAYQLEIKKPGSDEREKRSVDLVETFNWLIGLHVDKLHAGRRFTATFVRKPDPLLPEDANTRLQVETLTEAEEGAWWFRPVEGYVRTKPGEDRHRQSVLVLWRTLTDDPEQDAAALEAYLSQQMKFDPTRREDKTLYDIIYINGTHNLPNLGKYGEVRLLEEEFHRRMWAGEEA